MKGWSHTGYAKLSRCLVSLSPEHYHIDWPVPSQHDFSPPEYHVLLVNLAPPNIPKDITNKDLVAAMSKPFVSTKGNDTLRSKMLANQICLICRWHKSHAMGCP